MTSLLAHCRLLQLKKKTKNKKQNKKTQKKTTSLLACHHLLQPKKKNLDVGISWVTEDDNKPRSLSPSLLFFSSIVENDNKPRSRLIVILGCFSSIVEDNNEPPNSSSSLSVFSSVIKNDDKPRSWQAKILAPCCPWLFFFNCKRRQQDS